MHEQPATRGSPASPFVPARYAHVLGDGRIQCDVCPRFCKLHEGQSGSCLVRACWNGELVLTTYGEASGFSVDAIEALPLHHFLPGSTALCLGLAGGGREGHRRAGLTLEAGPASPRLVARAAGALACRCVAFVDDPTPYPEYATDTAEACHQDGLFAVVVTSGEICAEPRVDLYRHIDAASVELRVFTAADASGDLQPALETVAYLVNQTRVWVEISVLLLGGVNDSDQELDAMTRWVGDTLGPDVPLHLFGPPSPLPATPPHALRNAVRIARRNGLHYIYAADDPEAVGSTLCLSCGEVLIGRRGTRLTDWKLVEGGLCAGCGAPCPGLFDERPQGRVA